MLERAIPAGRAALRPILADRMLWIWAAVWLATRALMIAQVGLWNDVSGHNYQDADLYSYWSEILAHQHTMPPEETWQYPPGAALVMLAPRLGVAWLGAAYQPSFMVTMLLVDLAGLALMAFLARRTKRNAGVWIWLLAIPLLQSLPILRFDLVPTVLAMAALVVIHRRPVWFGALAGLGAMVKIWPIVVLFGEWNRRRLAISAVAAAGAAVLVFLVAAIPFGDQSGFFGNQNVRGLQVEAVAGVPWHLRQTITGTPPPTVQRDGSLEIASELADGVAVVLKWLGLLVLMAAALWWLARERAIRRGRIDLADAGVSRDFVFAILLMLLVVSRVLSPQFMIWLIGVAAVVLTAGDTRLARPAWITIAAIVMTSGIYAAPVNLAIRDVALLVAAIDAAVAMSLMLRGAPERQPVIDLTNLQTGSPDRTAASRSSP